MVDLRPSSATGDTSSSDGEAYELIDGKAGITTPRLNGKTMDDVVKQNDVSKQENADSSSEEMDYTCTFCPKLGPLEGKAAALTHWNTNHSDRPLSVVCPNCRKGFSSFEECRSHEAQCVKQKSKVDNCHEGKVTDINKGVNDEKPFRFVLNTFLLFCLICMATFAVSQSITTKSRLQQAIEANRVEKNAFEHRFEKMEAMSIRASQEVDLLKAELAKITRDQAADYERKAEIRTVSLKLGSDGLFGYEAARSVITGVTPGSSAECNGVRRGDQIIAVNGHRFDQLSDEEIVRIPVNTSGTNTFKLRFNPDALKDVAAAWRIATLHIAEEERKNRETAMNRVMSENEELKKQIEVLKSENLLLKSADQVILKPRTVTLTIREHEEYGIHRIRNSITKTQPGSPADTNGVLRGDQIISIDGINVDTENGDNISYLLRRARVSGRATLILKNNPELLKEMEELYDKRRRFYRTVSLKRGTNGVYGFYLRENDIVDVDAGSPAELAGLTKGDEIMKINEKNVVNLKTDAFFAVLNGVGRWNATFFLRNTQMDENISH